VIDILFVDDHPTMRYLIRQVLQTYAEFTIVGEATNGEEAVTQAAALQPSVILIDVNLPAMNGMQATKLMKVLSPGSAIIGLTAGSPEDVIERMIAAGAAAVVDKGELFECLHRSIIHAVGGVQNPVGPA
jgi:DNA-binding NarL/FixJ family response regulator